jgi:hypothetical protein
MSSTMKALHPSCHYHLIHTRHWWINLPPRQHGVILLASPENPPIRPHIIFVPSGHSVINRNPHRVLNVPMTKLTPTFPLPCASDTSVPEGVSPNNDLPEQDARASIDSDSISIPKRLSSPTNQNKPHSDYNMNPGSSPFQSFKWQKGIKNMSTLAKSQHLSIPPLLLTLAVT